MKIYVGIIGTGSIADDVHAPAIDTLEETELVAVLSRDIDRGTDFVHRHGSPEAKVYTSIDEFVSDPKRKLIRDYTTELTNVPTNKSQINPQVNSFEPTIKKTKNKKQNNAKNKQSPKAKQNNNTNHKHANTQIAIKANI